MSVRDEVEGDGAAIRVVHELAFGRRDEADIVDALTAEGAVAFSLVAENAGAIEGHVMLSVLQAPIPMLALAPLAVIPERQRQGIGSALVSRALEYALDGGWAAVLVLGHPDYYPRFGFSAEAARGYECKYAGPNLMLRVLRPPVPASGRIVYPAALDV